MRVSSQIKCLIVLLNLIQGLLIGEVTSSCTFSEKSVVERLKQLSSEEKRYLADFFFALIHDGGGYVLLGNKPLSICAYLNSFWSERHHIYSALESVHLHNIRIKKGWEVWKKYDSLFPLKNYIIFSETDYFNKEVQFIVFINRKNFSSVLDYCDSDFRKVLGRVITADKVIAECSTGNSLLYDVLEGHDALLGILLGYGRHNAWLFHRIVEINPWHPVKHRPFLQISPKPSTGFTSLESEFQEVNCKLDFFSEKMDLSDLNALLLSPPSFRADFTDPETQQLQREYKSSYHQILRYYNGKDFLEATLEQLLR